MIKRILVALDPDQDTPVATRYAAEVARRYDAAVSGLAVVDTGHIARELGPGGAIGATYYLEQARRRTVGEAREAGQTLVAAFEAVLDEAGVRHGERVEEGAPDQRIIEDMKYSDLLVIGRTPRFFYHQPERETPTLAKIVKRGVAPALVVGAEYRAVERVLIAYDGSDPAARTLQRFAQLQPFGRDLAVELVHVHEGETTGASQRSELLLRLACPFLQAHGFERVTETSMVGGEPAEQLLEQADRVGADLIVAGAHSVSAVRRMAFGSTTHTLLETCTLPLFLFN
jgi:nucleotide-binding universal stress UspA family protein